MTGDNIIGNIHSVDMVKDNTLFFFGYKRQFNGGFNGDNAFVNPFLQFSYQLIEPDISVNLLAAHIVVFCNS